MNTIVRHGIELFETYHPPRGRSVINQWRATIRGREFLMIHRSSPGGQYNDYEAHEYHSDTQSYTINEFSRELSSLVQLVIDNVERESMNRLKPKRSRPMLKHTTQNAMLYNMELSTK